MSTHTEPIAILSLAGRFPKANDIESLEHLLKNGEEGLSHHLAHTGEEGHVGSYGILDAPYDFDAKRFGMSPREARLLDPQQRLLLELTLEVFHRAALPTKTHAARTGVWMATGLSSHLMQAIRHLPPDELDGLLFELIQGNAPDNAATRVAYKMGFGGEALSIGTNCSGSLVAVAVACRALRSGSVDLAVAGGASIRLPQDDGYVHSPGSIFSSDGHCRAYSSHASGTVPGNGGGVVLLKRLADAQRDLDPIVAVIRGEALNNDGNRKLGYTAPSLEGQVDLLEQLLRQAHWDPSDVHVIEGHGTGTELGDAIETKAIGRVWADCGQAPWLGTLKSNLGHLDAAAGVSSLIKAALMVKNQVLYKSLHCDTQNPALVGGPLEGRILSNGQNWSGPLRAVVTSFGVGGTNAAVALESPRPHPHSPWRVDHTPAFGFMPLRGDSPQGVKQRANSLKITPQTIIPLAETLFQCEEPRPLRGHVPWSHSETKGIRLGPVRVPPPRKPGKPPKLCWVFTGQGSAFTGMARGLAPLAPLFLQEIQEGEDFFKTHCGVNLTDAFWSDTHKPILDTQVVQAALAVFEWALAQQLLHWGTRPQLLMGHSLGEWVAYAVAGGCTRETLYKAVALRGQTLSQWAPKGAMAALPRTQAEALGLGQGVWLSASNAPEQVVVGGSADDIEDFLLTCAEEGATARRLHTDHAFHTPLFADAAQRFAEGLAQLELRPADARFVKTCLSAAPSETPAYWADQIRLPVSFSEALSACLETGPHHFLEVGPLDALAKLIRQHPSPHLCGVSLPLCPLPASGADPSEALGALGGDLWALQLPFDPKVWGLGGGVQGERPPLPPPHFEKSTLTLHFPGETDTGSAPHQLPPSSPLVSTQERLEKAQLAFASTLGLPQVLPNDSFFDLGGDSLQAIALVKKLSQLWNSGVVAVQDLVKNPTPQRLTQSFSPTPHLPPSLTQSPHHPLSPSVLPPDSLKWSPSARSLPLEGTLPPPDTLVITGANGYLGAHAVGFLSRNPSHKIVALVRAESLAAAENRLDAQLLALGFRSLRECPRVEVLAADVSRPWLGLSPDAFDALAARVAHVFHTAAWVNHLYPIETLAPTNIHAVGTLLDLLHRGQGRATLHHVSSVSVCSSDAYGSRPETLFEGDFVRTPQRFRSAYGLSKWAAEQVAFSGRDQGLRVAIYRAANIGGALSPVSCNGKDALWSMLRAFSRMGAAPISLQSEPIPIIPVDYFVAVWEAAMAREATGVFHITSKNNPTWEVAIEALQDALGQTVDWLPLEEWEKRARIWHSSNKGEPALQRIFEGQDDSVQSDTPVAFDNARAIELLRSDGLFSGKTPDVDADLFKKYLCHLHSMQQI